jgi:hypothetical protein
MVPADIGLGNVPNWKPATPAQAIDPTNTNTFMSPYTTSLLIQKLQNDPRLDQLIIDFNQHILANNPHHITPQMIGTYTSVQIDSMIAAVSQGGDAVTFGGESPQQWVAKFPAVADINQMLTEAADVWNQGYVDVSAIDVADPNTPEAIALKESRRASWCFGQYNAYAVYNSIGEGIIMADRSLRGNYPTVPLPGASGKWATADQAGYYIRPDGSISTWGALAINIPAVYRTGTMTAGNESDAIYASKDYLYLYLKAEKLVLIKRDGTVNVGPILEDVGTIHPNMGITDAREFAIIEISPAPDVRSWQARGDSGFVAAINALNARATSEGFTITDMRLGTDNVLVQYLKGADSKLLMYRLTYGATVTMTDVTAGTTLMDHSTGIAVAMGSLATVNAIDGSYTHFTVLQPDGPGSTIMDLYSFGSNVEGQLEITPMDGPFISCTAGYNFTVTVNRHNYTEYWGNSPDNSLYWRDGAYIDIGGL